MAELRSRRGHCLSESWGVLLLIVCWNRLGTSRSLSVFMTRLGSTASGNSFLFSHSLNCIIGHSFNSIAFMSCVCQRQKHVDVCLGETTSRTRVSTGERGDVDCMRRFKTQLPVHSTHVTCPFHAQKLKIGFYYSIYHKTHHAEILYLRC